MILGAAQSENILPPQILQFITISEYQTPRNPPPSPNVVHEWCTQGQLQFKHTPPPLWLLTCTECHPQIEFGSNSLSSKGYATLLIVPQTCKRSDCSDQHYFSSFMVPDSNQSWPHYLSLLSSLPPHPFVSFSSASVTIVDATQGNGISLSFIAMLPTTRSIYFSSASVNIVDATQGNGISLSFIAMLPPTRSICFSSASVNVVALLPSLP